MIAAAKLNFTDRREINAGGAGQRNGQRLCRVQANETCRNHRLLSYNTQAPAVERLEVIRATAIRQRGQNVRGKSAVEYPLHLPTVTWRKRKKSTAPPRGSAVEGRTLTAPRRSLRSRVISLVSNVVRPFGGRPIALPRSRLAIPLRCDCFYRGASCQRRLVVPGIRHEHLVKITHRSNPLSVGEITPGIKSRGSSQRAAERQGASDGHHGGSRGDRSHARDDSLLLGYITSASAVERNRID